MKDLFAIVRAVRAAIEAGDAPAAAKLYTESGLDDPATLKGLTCAEAERLCAEVDVVLALAQTRQAEMARSLMAGGTARRAEALYQRPRGQ